MQYTGNGKYRTYFLNDNKTRWINVDNVGKKDTITLKTESGRLETRTCQYWSNFTSGIKAKITYKRKVYFVTEDTVLED
jgi:hypothetical protein